MIFSALLIRLAGAGLILGAAAAGIGWWNHHEREIGRAEVQAKWNAEKLAQAQLDAEAARENQRLQAKWNTKSQEAQDAANQAMGRARTARDAARTETERLRDYLDSVEAERVAAGEAISSSGSDGYAAVSRDLLAACAGRYSELAGEAGELAARLGGLQVWTRGVCTEPVTEGGRMDR